MNTTTTNEMLSMAKRTITMAESGSGLAEPQIQIHLPKGSTIRQLTAALHTLAAHVELATPDGERWLVQMEAFRANIGRVFLELATTSAEEADRGLALLRRVAG